MRGHGPMKFGKSRKIDKTREHYDIRQKSYQIRVGTNNIFEIYRGYWGCLLALNLKIYLEISSLHAQEVRRLFFDTIRIVKYCL